MPQETKLSGIVFWKFFLQERERQSIVYLLIV